MCAIIGASAPENQLIDIKNIKILYLMAEDRGGDACGFTNGKRIIKKAVKSYEYINDIMKLDEFPKEINHFIGHTRYATIGLASEDKNAHPFAKGNGSQKLIGVHNGSLYNFEDLKALTGTKASVDSEMLYEMISKIGLENTLPLVQGLVALSYYDVKTQQIFLYRIYKDLHIGYKDNILYWATLGEYLDAIGCEKIEKLDEHTLYTIQGGKVLKKQSLKKVLRPTEPETYTKHNVKYYDKKPTLNIFKDYKNHIKSLEVAEYTEALKKYEDLEAEKAKEEKEKSESRPRTEEVRLLASNIESVPKHAQYYMTEEQEEILFWWSHDKTGILNIFLIELDYIELFNLTMKSEDERLYKQYGGNDELINAIYAQYEFMFFAQERIDELTNEKTNTNSYA